MKIKLHHLFFGCLIMAGYSAIAQTNQTLTVASGYNADVIVNGIGSAASSSTNSVDNVNYAFMSRDFQISASSPTYAYALPANGTITSAANAAIQFQFAPYSGNNSLRLQQTGNSGTLAFSNQIMARNLYIVATGGSGAVTVSTIVTFDDGTTQAATGAVIPDWYNDNSLPVVISGIGRVSRADNGIQNETGNPRLYMYTIAINTANQTKRVSSIQFTKTSSAEGTLNVFAVTANAVPCTTPPVPVVQAQEFCGITTVSQLAATGAVTGGSFKWYTTSTGGTALTATTPVTSGIHYVSQVNGTCESARVPVEITVNNTLQPGGASAQTVCDGATIADLTATPVTGATVAWTYNGTAVPAGTPLQSGTYQVTQTVNGCASLPKTVEVTVGVTTPVADIEQILCEGAVVGDLVATTIPGATIQYFLVGILLQEVQPTAGLVNGLTYSIRQSIGSCQSGSANVQVNLIAPPAQLEGDETQDFTIGETVANLEYTVNEGATVTWYIRNDAMEYIVINPQTTPLTDGTTYYVTQSTGYCESPYLAITVSEVMAASHHAIKNSTVYPNPAITIVTVNNSEIIFEVAVTNLLGHKIFSQTVNALNAEVNVAALQAGTYLLQVYTTNGFETIKFIKQ
jgi:hypothetical protein